ncbi:hypothetical protein N9Z58_00820 [bacterium]|nr:hypothetical protein [bacterium]MDA7901694.1 hypothetical protein [bacterium]MDB4357483.1 hypothetical protein [Mariniblastus sp.]MDB4368655.1 hypothetical protein [bacterium]MDB4545322.1 hypothetical protein [bacterium]
MNSKQILDREFLEIRAKILEVAAALDRIERAEGDVSGEPRMALIAEAIKIIASGHSDPIRAEKIQLLFSRTYDEQWRDEFSIASRS